MLNTITEAVTQSGVIWKRAAESVLRSVGGVEIQLIVSGSPQVDENSRELGLPAGGSQQFAISPVVVSWLPAKPAERTRAEIFIAAASLEGAIEASGASSGVELLQNALAIVFGERRLRIAAVQVGAAGGAEYLYTVTAVL